MESETLPNAGQRSPSLFTRVRSACVELLFEPTILVLSLLACIGGGIILFNQHRLQSRQIHATTLRDAERYTEALAAFRTLYTAEVVEVVRKAGIEVTHDYQDKERTIPLPATLSMELGRRITEKLPGGMTRLYSAYPFPWRKTTGGLQDDFAKAAWASLNEHPEKPFYRIEEVDGLPSLRYATADLMRRSCVNCHNTHPDTPKKDWNEGDVRGVLEVSFPLAEATSEVQTNLRESFFLMGVMGVLGLVGIAVVIGKLRRTAVNLEQSVRDRTNDLSLANRQLEMANAELKRSNKELDEFAYTASHDLRSPMEAIHNLADWISEDATEVLSDKSAKHLQQMQQRVVRMQKLLDDLLEYSRAGRVPADIVEVETAQLVRETVDMLAMPQYFTVSISEGMPRLVTAKVPLEQVFRNLIGNAIKHHDRDDGRVEVSSEDAAAFVEFSVTDDGPGIAEEFHKQIFQMFEALRPRDQVEGSGMGLAVARKIVENYGGIIKLESSEGSGATFRFTWPKTMSIQG